MDIKSDVILPFSRELVFAAYRDHLAELTEYLPNIQSIQVTRREALGDDIKLVNEWVGGGDIPKAARVVVKENMLRWTDFATWHSKTFSVDWRTEVGVLPGAVQSSGCNRYIEIPEGVRLEIRGTLTCDAAKVPGVPRFVAGTVNPIVEKFLVGQVSVNLVEVAKGVGKWLEKQKAKA